MDGYRTGRRGGDIQYTVIFNSIYARGMGYNTFIAKIDIKELLYL